MQRDERLELGDEDTVAPAREVGVDPLLECRQPRLVQALDLHRRSRLEEEVGERRAAPEAERLPQRVSDLVRTRQALRLLDELLEAPRVDVGRIDVEHVAARLREQPRLAVLRLEQLPEPRDVHLERVRGRLGRRASPELVDEPVRRERLIRVQQEDREQLAALACVQADGAVVAHDLERAEHSKLHRPSVSAVPRKPKAQGPE